VIGIIYGSSTLNTEFVSQKLLSEIGESSARLHNIRELTPQSFAAYSGLILVTSTWGTGDLQDDWEEFYPNLDSIDFSGKTVALVGLGDQKNYPEQFCDSIGLLYDKLLSLGVRIVGETSTDGYDFKRSGARRDNRFVGLVIDEDNQSVLTDERVREWVKTIRREFRL